MLHRSIVPSLAFLLAAVWAAAPAHAYDSESVKKYKTLVMKEMCKGGGEWVRCYQQEPFNCGDVAQYVVPDCVDEILAKTPSLERSKFVEWFSEDLHACMKAKFDERYGSMKVDSPECTDQ